MKSCNLPSQLSARQRPRTWLAGACLLLGLAGCGRERVPAHDRLPLETIQGFFAAARAGDASGAERQLRRIEDVPGGPQFVPLARREVLIRKCQDGVARCCAAGQLDEATAILRQAHQDLGPLPELEPLAQLLSALGTVQAYLRQMPFANSSAAERALAPVIARQADLQGSPAFTAWLAEQQQEIAQMRRREVVQELRQLALAYDAAFVSGRADAPELLRRLLALPPSTPASAAALEVLAAPAATLSAWAEKPAAWADPATGLYLEIRFCQEWPALPAATRDRLALQPLPQEPFSLCGMLLRARLAARKGSLALAASWSERLLRRTAIARPLVEEGLTGLVLPRDQYQARAWRTPFPSLTDYLDRLEQLRQSQH